MIQWLKRKWFDLFIGPRYKRRLRDGVVAYLEVNEMMKRAHWPRQRRRHLLRDLQRNPNSFAGILDLIYQEKGK